MCVGPECVTFVDLRAAGSHPSLGCEARVCVLWFKGEGFLSLRLPCVKCGFVPPYGLGPGQVRLKLPAQSRVSVCVLQGGSAWPPLPTKSRLGNAQSSAGVGASPGSTPATSGAQDGKRRPRGAAELSGQHRERENQKQKK